jgi:hypothetical protein
MAFVQGMFTIEVGVDEVAIAVEAARVDRHAVGGGTAFMAFEQVCEPAGIAHLDVAVEEQKVRSTVARVVRSGIVPRGEEGVLVELDERVDRSPGVVSRQEISCRLLGAVVDDDEFV